MDIKKKLMTCDNLKKSDMTGIDKIINISSESLNNGILRHLYDFAIKHTFKNIVFCHNQHIKPNVTDTIFLYSIISNNYKMMNIHSITIDNIEYKSGQSDFHIDSTYKQGIPSVLFKTTNKETIACYDTINNNMYLSDLHHYQSIAGLRYTKKVLKNISDNLNVYDFNVIKPDEFVSFKHKIDIVHTLIDNPDEYNKKYTEFINRASTDFNDSIKELNKKYVRAIENIQNNNIRVPDFVYFNKIPIIHKKISDKHFIDVLYGIKFKVNKVKFKEYTYDISSMTKEYNVMLCITIDNNFKIKSLHLMKPTLDNFIFLHNRPSIYNNTEICLGSYDASIYDITLDSGEALIKICDIMSKMLSEINMDGEIPSSTHMTNEINIVNDILNNPDKFKKNKKKLWVMDSGKKDLVWTTGDNPESHEDNHELDEYPD